MTTTSKRRAALALLALAACGAAWAAPTTFVSVGAGFDSTTLTGTTPLDASATALTGAGGPGTAQATAHADFGTLGIFATATANGGYAFPVIGASAAAYFTDDMFVSGVAGTMVTITMTLVLEGTCTATDGATGGFVDAACGIGGSLIAPPGATATGALNSQTNTQTATFEWAADSSFGFGAQVSASGYANFGTFTADYGHTLHLFIDSLTDGVTLASASGHDYSTPVPTSGGTVPEPASWTLALAGLAALARRPRSLLSRAA